MLKVCKSLPPAEKLNFPSTSLINETLVPRVGLHPVAFSGNMMDPMPQREVTTGPTASQDESDGR